MSKTKKEHKNIVKHTNNGKKESVQSVAKETERVTWSNKQTNEEKKRKNTPGFVRRWQRRWGSQRGSARWWESAVDSGIGPGWRGGLWEKGNEEEEHGPRTQHQKSETVNEQQHYQSFLSSFFSSLWSSSSSSSSPSPSSSRSRVSQ